MRFSQYINKLLSNFDIAIARRSMLNQLKVELQQLRSALDMGDRLTASDLRSGLGKTRDDLLRHQIGLRWSIVDHCERMLSTLSVDPVCPLCGHTGSTDSFKKYESQCIFQGGRLIRLQCPYCDLIFGAHKMLSLSEAELSQDYEWHYQVHVEGDSTEQEVRAFHALNPSKDGVYLNYGAGAWSRTIELLNNQGWNVYGYEPHASATGNGKKIIGSLDALTKMQFDGLFSNNVLEHIRYPVKEFALMRSLLKPGAVMAHATPCFEYLYEYTRFHLFFYLGRSKEVLAHQTGFSIKEFIKDGEFMVCILEPAAQ